MQVIISAEFVNARVCGGAQEIGFIFPNIDPERGPASMVLWNSYPPAVFLVYLHAHRTKAQAASSPAELLGTTLATSSRSPLGTGKAIVSLVVWD